MDIHLGPEYLYEIVEDTNSPAAEYIRTASPELLVEISELAYFDDKVWDAIQEAIISAALYVKDNGATGGP